METIKEYDAKLDNKKRLTIRGAKYNHYKVKELIDANLLSENTLKMIDKSVTHFKKGKASAPINLSKFKKIG